MRAVFMRGGTSKGLFLHAADLPPAGPARDRMLLRLMGSPDPYGRQLDGMGGGISSLSKVIVVRPADPGDPDADVEYIHGQVAVDRAVVDWSANCGNLTVAVGPFALDEGLVVAPQPDGTVTLRLRNLNTATLIHARVPVQNGHYTASGDFVLAGVAGRGARVAVDYLRPGMPGTSALFPTGQAQDALALPDGRRIVATLAMAALPMVWVQAADVGLDAAATPDCIEQDTAAMAALDHLRRAGAVQMGLAATPEAAALASPKIGLLGPPAPSVALDGRPIAAGDADIVARVVSMGRIHKAIPLTGAMCLAAASQVPGTVPHGLLRGAIHAGLRVSTPSGVVTVDASVGPAPGPGQSPPVLRVTTYSTARRLMDGHAYADADPPA